MNRVSKSFLHLDTNTAMAVNDIDERCIDLLHVDPPVDMVARIMRAISHLPQPKPLSQWANYDFFLPDYEADLLS